MRKKNPDRPVKCMYCHYKARTGKAGEDCTEGCGREDAMVWNWLHAEKQQKRERDDTL